MWATAQIQVVMTARTPQTDGDTSLYHRRYNIYDCTDSSVSRCLLASDFVNESLVGNYED